MHSPNRAEGKGIPQSKLPLDMDKKHPQGLRQSHVSMFKLSKSPDDRTVPWHKRRTGSEKRNEDREGGEGKKFVYSSLDQVVQERS